MTFVDAVTSVLGKYATFSGRARRREFWYWYLAVILFELVVGIISSALDNVGLWIALISALALILPGLAVSARRLHDTDRSGWWLLIGLVPFGGLVLLVFFLLDGTPGDNRYGPSPKTAAPPGIDA